MTSPLPYPIHTIAEVATQISQGEDPWFALGGFLHDWWCDAKDYRQDLISEPPLSLATPEGRRWAAVCAAVVEELCSRTGFPTPHGSIYKTTHLTIPGFIPRNHHNAIGYLQQHHKHFSTVTFLSAAVF